MVGVAVAVYELALGVWGVNVGVRDYLLKCS